ncbi:hypothetical protein D1007_49429 [Hordeum vulgare]|nr:hypothetical protein D1007_49429 [Hordeum vulgare]
MVRLVFRPIPKSDERFARQYRFEPPPEFPLASPRSGIVHHLSGPDRRAPTRTLHRRSGSASGAAREGLPLVSFLAHPRFQNPSTRTHVRLLGPCFKTGRMGSPQAVASAVPRGTRLSARGYRPCRRRQPEAPRAPGLWPPTRPTTVHTPSRGRTSKSRSAYGRGASPAPIRFPPGNFKHSLTLFSKYFSSFPCGTCSLSVSRLYLALDGVYRPIWAAFPNNPTR